MLTPADEEFHVDKTKFSVPFVCGCRDLGEALRRISEGAAMIRTKGEAGSGNIVEAIRHIRAVNRGIAIIQGLLKQKKTAKLKAAAKEFLVPLKLVIQTAKLGRLPVVNFAAGGIATPADAALCLQLGVDGVFVGSGIFKSSDPARRAKAIVEAAAHYNDAQKIAQVSEGLGEAMPGQEIDKLATRLASRGI